MIHPSSSFDLLSSVLKTGADATQSQRLLRRLHHGIVTKLGTCTQIDMHDRFKARCTRVKQWPAI